MDALTTRSPVVLEGAPYLRRFCPRRTWDCGPRCRRIRRIRVCTGKHFGDLVPKGYLPTKLIMWIDGGPSFRLVSYLKKV